MAGAAHAAAGPVKAAEAAEAVAEANVGVGEEQEEEEASPDAPAEDAALLAALAAAPPAVPVGSPRSLGSFAFPLTSPATPSSLEFLKLNLHSPTGAAALQTVPGGGMTMQSFEFELTPPVSTSPSAAEAAAKALAAGAPPERIQGGLQPSCLSLSGSSSMSGTASQISLLLPRRLSPCLVSGPAPSPGTATLPSILPTDEGGEDGLAGPVFEAESGSAAQYAQHGLDSSPKPAESACSTQAAQPRSFKFQPLRTSQLLRGPTSSRLPSASSSSCSAQACSSAENTQVPCTPVPAPAAASSGESLDGAFPAGAVIAPLSGMGSNMPLAKARPRVSRLPRTHSSSPAAAPAPEAAGTIPVLGSPTSAASESAGSSCAVIAAGIAGSSCGSAASVAGPPRSSMHGDAPSPLAQANNTTAAAASPPAASSRGSLKSGKSSNGKGGIPLPSPSAASPGAPSSEQRSTHSRSGPSPLISKLIRSSSSGLSSSASGTASPAHHRLPRAVHLHPQAATTATAAATATPAASGSRLPSIRRLGASAAASATPSSSEASSSSAPASGTSAAIPSTSAAVPLEGPHTQPGKASAASSSSSSSPTQASAASWGSLHESTDHCKPENVGAVAAGMEAASELVSPSDLTAAERPTEQPRGLLLPLPVLPSSKAAHTSPSTPVSHIIGSAELTAEDAGAEDVLLGRDSEQQLQLAKIPALLGKEELAQAQGCTDALQDVFCR